MKRGLYVLQDPTKQYPRPKFGHQPQRVPGLDKKMKPKADHGESSYRGSNRLPNRKALITGGDSGIGRAAAIAFAREGADVAINYLPSEEADAREVISLIEQAGRKAFALPGDLSKEPFARKLVKDAHNKLGGLDILACVAGRQHAVEAIKDLTTKQLEETYRVNVFTLFWMCQAALPLMPPGGSICHHCIDPGDSSESESSGLCTYEGSHPRIHAGARTAGGRARYSRQLRGTRPSLDSASNQRRSAKQEDPQVWI